MLKFLLAERLSEKEAAEKRRIGWGEVAEAIGVSRQALATLASGQRKVVTNTAHLEALCRYFKCDVGEIVALDPPPDAKSPCHVDRLYPGRRKKPQ